VYPELFLSGQSGRSVKLTNPPEAEVKNLWSYTYISQPGGKRPLGRPRRRWVDNIRIELQEVGCGYMDWIWLAQDRDGWRRLVSAAMNLRVP